MNPDSVATLAQRCRDDATWIEEYATRIIGPTVALQAIATNARSAAEALEALTEKANILGEEVDIQNALREKHKAEVATLSKQLAEALALLNDDAFIRTLYDYRARGHLSYGGQLAERVGDLNITLRHASRAGQKEKERKT